MARSLVRRALTNLSAWEFEVWHLRCMVREDGGYPLGCFETGGIDPESCINTLQDELDLLRVEAWRAFSQIGAGHA